MHRSTEFHSMRAELVARGLLQERDGRHVLTAKGRAYTDSLLEDLREAEAPCDPEAPRVRWNMHWPACRSGEAARG